jgi:hypothetical protein
MEFAIHVAQARNTNAQRTSGREIFVNCRCGTQSNESIGAYITTDLR